MSAIVEILVGNDEAKPVSTAMPRSSKKLLKPARKAKYTAVENESARVAETSDDVLHTAGDSVEEKLKSRSPE